VLAMSSKTWRCRSDLVSPARRKHSCAKSRNSSAAGGMARVLSALRLRFGFLGQAPELKSFGFDGLFDRIARRIMRRSFLWPDRPGGSPRTQLLGKPAAREIAGEGLQTFPRFRLENINSHH